jgi:hypothetical protein
MCGATAPFRVCSFTASPVTTVPKLHYDREIGYTEDSSPCSNKLFNQMYRAIRTDCLGFNNLSCTVHLREEYVVAPMDQEILKVFFY